MAFFQIRLLRLSRSTLFFLTALVVWGLLCAGSMRGAGVDAWGRLGTPVLQTHPLAQTGVTGKLCFSFQMPDGLMVVGGSDGVHVFDGAHWDIIAESGSAFGYCSDGEGRIFIGSDGFLHELMLGKSRSYNVRRIAVTGRVEHKITRLVYFRGMVCGSYGKGLFSYSEANGMRVFEQDSWVQGVAVADGSFYVTLNRAEGNFCRFDPQSGALTVVPPPESLLKSADKITDVLPRDDDNCWLVTARGAVYNWDGVRVRPAPWFSNDPGLLLHVSSIQPLPGGGHAVGTLGQGVYFCDELGRVEYVLNAGNGLGDSNVQGLSLDREGGLWLTTLRSLHRLDARRRFVNYAQGQGLDLPSARVVTRHRGLLHVGGLEGLFVQNSSAIQPAKAFVRAEGISSVSDLLSAEEGLWIASAQLCLMDDQRIDVLDINSPTSLLRRKGHPDELVVGTVMDLRFLRRRGGRWVQERVLNTEGRTVFSIVETPEGSLWVGLGSGRVGRVSFADGVPVMAIYGPAKGVPVGWVDVALYAGRIYLGVEAPACLVYSEKEDSFLPTGALRYFPGSGPYGFAPVFGPDENNFFIKPKVTSGLLQPRPERAVIGVLQNCEQNPDVHASGILDEGDEGRWICHPGGLLQVRGGQIEDTDMPGPVPTLLRRLEDLQTREILLGQTSGTANLAIERRHHSLRVVAALPSFQAEQFTRFRIWLEGVDAAPPPWSPSATREFTTLPAGHYRLLIQSRDMLGMEHPPVEIALDIAQHPLLGAPAIAVYLLLGVLLVWTLIRIRENILRKSNDELRIAVERRGQEAERTSKLLLEKNRQLEGILQDMEQLAIDAKKAADAKTRFLAAMSHEIRTPMNGVIGMGALLSETRLDQEQRDYLGIIQTSAESLLSLINDILDYSKAASGKLTLEQLTFDLRSLVDEILELLAPQASLKRLDLLLEIDASFQGGILGDPIRLRQVLINLLGNAIKFTERGHVTLRITRTGRLPAPRLRIDIVDTGIGIAPDKMDVLFKPFSQVDSSTTRRYGGTGLGLAISKQIVDAMGGRIWLSGSGESGSTFSIEFPASLSDCDYSYRNAPAHGRHFLLLMPEGATSRHLRSLMYGGLAELFVTPELQGDDLLPLGFTPDLIFIQDSQIPQLLNDQVQLTLFKERFPSVPLIILGNMMPDASSLGEGRKVFAMGRPITRGSLLRTMTKARGQISASVAHDIPNLAEIGTVKYVPFGDIGPLLLVEDNSVNQKTALLSLKRLGLEADLAINGRDALAAISRKDYRIIFMDVHMPGMDGLEVTRKIREKYEPSACPRIIVMTAGVMKEDLRAIELVGVDAVLAKPFRVSDLEKVLRACAQELMQANGG